MKLFRISTIPVSLNILLKGQLKYLSSFYDVTAISGGGENLREVKQREEVSIHSIEIQRSISIFRDVISLLKLYFYFKKEKPDIIHSITPKAGLLSMVAGKWAGVPVRMHTFTGLMFPYRKGPMRQLLILMDKILCHHATNIYPEGQGVKEQLLQHSITQKPLKVLANGNVNGVDAKHFSRANISLVQRSELRAELGIPEDAFVFVFVGRVVGDKGINELVSAFSKNFKDGNVRLLLVGRTERKNDPLQTRTVKEIRKNPNIHAVGFQADVRPYYAISNALTFPSYREGFPNVVLQAGAMQLPSIVTNIPGCNEIIRDRQNGLIIPVKNADSLAESMLLMINDSVLRQQLVINLRQEIDEKYNQRRVWEALRDEYERLSDELKSKSIVPSLVTPA